MTLREQSLFQRLGRCQSNYASDDERWQSQIDSVKHNVQQMLNVRVGSVSALRDFGMPDVNDLIYEFPDAIAQLQQAIKSFLLRYEPRIEAVDVHYLPDRDQPLQLRYRIAVVMRSDRHVNETVKFDTVITGSGQAFVATA